MNVQSKEPRGERENHRSLYHRRNYFFRRFLCALFYTKYNELFCSLHGCVDCLKMSPSKPNVCGISWCFLVYSLFTGQCDGRLKFLILTVTESPAIGARAMVPGFQAALDESANRYPRLFANYSVHGVSVTPPAAADPCSPAGAGVLVEMSRLYGTDGLSSLGDDTTQIILTPGTVTIPTQSAFDKYSAHQHAIIGSELIKIHFEN